MNLSQKTLVFFVFMMVGFTLLSGILDKKESFLVTKLTSSITETDLTLEVTEDTNDEWPTSGYFWIGDEYIKYDSRSAVLDTFTVNASGRGYSYGSKETTARFHTAGSLVRAPDADTINTLLGYDTIVVTTDVGGIVGLAQTAWSFLKALPKMIMWDYSFLQGELVLLKYIFLYPLSVGFIVTFIMVFTQWARNLLRIL